ncbi:MAG: hypothetical protein QXW70_02425 [Candidatus Anstonellales archaeon]
MDILVKNERENKSIGRREIEFEGATEGKTASRKEVLEALARKFAVDVENIVIKRIVNVYGSHKFQGTANIYSDREVLKVVEPAYLIKRGTVKEKEVKEK